MDQASIYSRWVLQNVRHYELGPIQYYVAGFENIQQNNQLNTPHMEIDQEMILDLNIGDYAYLIFINNGVRYRIRAQIAYIETVEQYDDYIEMFGYVHTDMGIVLVQFFPHEILMVERNGIMESVYRRIRPVPIQRIQFLLP